MLSKQRLMKFVYWLPAVLAIIRVVVTFWFLFSNPLELPLRFFQVILIVVYIGTSFSYYKLYRDGVPVLSIISPTLIHAILIFIFKRVIVIAPFAVLFALDIVFLVSKGVKANLYPFDIEGLSDEDDPFAEDELEMNEE